MILSTEIYNHFYAVIPKLVEREIIPKRIVQMTEIATQATLVMLAPIVGQCRSRCEACAYKY